MSQFLDHGRAYVNRPALQVVDSAPLAVYYWGHSHKLVHLVQTKGKESKLRAKEDYVAHETIASVICPFPLTCVFFLFQCGWVRVSNAATWRARGS